MKIEYFKEGKLVSRQFDDNEDDAIVWARTWLRNGLGHNVRIFELNDREWCLLHDLKGADIK